VPQLILGKTIEPKPQEEKNKLSIKIPLMGDHQSGKRISDNNSTSEDSVKSNNRLGQTLVKKEQILQEISNKIN
jgi:hypothetical protein